MSSIKVRKADDGDVSGIAAIHVRSWQAAYRGILPEALLDGLSASEREESWRELLVGGEDRWLTLVAESTGGGLMGFCSAATPSRDEGVGDATAEIGAIYVDPAYWRQGAGSAMLSAAFEELRRQGRHDVVLWVLPENRSALAFYDSFGFEIEEGIEKREQRSGRRVIRLRAALAVTDEPIQLVPYDPSWPARFAEERLALDEAVGAWVTGGIHHVGSTAVPGLDAKPIVDILVGVDSLGASRACCCPLAKLDYLYAPYRVEEMHWFCKPHPSRRTHHLHLVPTDSRRFHDEIAFRDLLRANSEVAQEYAALKRSLARRFSRDREAYTEAKTDFIASKLGEEVSLTQRTWNEPERR